MHLLRPLLIAALASALIVITSNALAADAANVAGTWKLSVDAMGRTNTPTVVIAQDGSTLSGTYKGRAGEYPISGEATAGAMHFDVAISMMGREMTLRYKGTVDGDNIKGDVSMGGDTSGTFTAVREAQ